MNTTFRFLMFLCCAATAPASAQSIGPGSINTSGGRGLISSEAFEYAVGQLTPGQSASAGAILITPEVLQPQLQAAGVIEQVSENALRVFPNPASTTLFLQPALQAGTTLEYALHDAAGKVVSRGTASLSQGTERQTLQVETLSAGFYTLKTSWTSGGSHYEAAFKVQKLQ